METEPVPQEELKQDEKLPEAGAYHVFGRKEAVDCPYCGGMEHAPDIGQPGCVKECELEVEKGIEHPKKYIVKKAA
jgi:hypothetical protein